MLHVVFEAIVLGIVQGLTEFIPVSSSGHLLLLGELLTTSISSFYFDVVVNIGTLSALIVYFRKRLVEIARNWSMIGLLSLTTVPAVMIGVILPDAVLDSIRSPQVVLVNMFVVSLLMLAADRWKTTDQRLPSNLQALAIGVAQVLAFIPGTSRSGITILAGRATGLSYTNAAEYSFIASIPIIGGAVIKTLLDGSGDTAAQPWVVYAVGIISAGVAGWIAIAFVLKLLQQSGFKYFAYYRIIFVIMVSLLLLID